MDALKNNEFYNVKFLVRFLCELANAKVTTFKSVFAVFEKLLSDGIFFKCSAYLSDPAAPQGRRDLYSMTVMQSLPCVAPNLHIEDQERLKGIMEKLDAMIQNRDEVRLSYF